MQMLVRKDVNINIYPGDQSLRGATNATIGDLHGHFIKLMFSLVHEGICAMPPEQYDSLVELYAIPVDELATAHIEDFDALIAAVQIKKRNVLFRLIGDEVADRGSNDYFTLKLLDRLVEEQVPVEILISNHGVGLIEAYEYRDSFIYPKLDIFARSLHNMQRLVDRGLVSRAKIIEMIDKSYKPCLKLLSYALDLTRNKITLFSHAPIDIDVIRSLAIMLELPFQDENPTELAQTIDAINEKFKDFVYTNSVHSLYNNGALGAAHKNLRNTIDPIAVLTWNRDYLNLNRSNHHKNYNVHYVHGHDSLQKSHGHVINLDNILGKTIEFCRGWYEVFVSNDSLSLKPQTICNSLYHFPSGPSREAKENFLLQLNTLALKKMEFIQRREKLAYQVVKKLERKLKDAQYSYYRQPDEVNYLLFKEKAELLIADARVELDKHRGWKQLLGNLLCAVLGLGVFYLAAVIYNNGHLFFATDSSKKMDALERSIEDLAPSEILTL